MRFPIKTGYPVHKFLEAFENYLPNVTSVSSVRVGDVLISEDDLQYWLERHLPRQTPAAKKHVRYAGDAALIAEGIKGVQDRKWPNASQAALELAPRAEGAETAKVDRLRRAISKGLGK
jgi:hypothetical protein